MGVSREVRRYMKRENARMPDALVRRPPSDWPARLPEGLIEVWQSKRFLVQVYEPTNGGQRLSICRAALNDARDRWLDGITWDDLQLLKSECGRGDRMAVEIFPADADVVNVANMRHLWLLDDPLPFAWSATRRQGKAVAELFDERSGER